MMLKVWCMVFLIVFVMMYAVLSYIMAELNPMTWEKGARGLHMAISLLAPTLSALMVKPGNGSEETNEGMC